MATAEEAIRGLKDDNKEISKKIDKLQWWIMSTAAGVAGTLIINLIMVKGR